VTRLKFSFAVSKVAHWDFAPLSDRGNNAAQPASRNTRLTPPKFISASGNRGRGTKEGRNVSISKIHVNPARLKIFLLLAAITTNGVWPYSTTRETLSDKKNRRPENQYHRGV
jgi:hypothetical protein